MKKACVLGLGYIGLPTASLLATKGFMVHGVDVNEKVVESINQGEIHFYEPDLDILVKSAVKSHSLVASSEPVSADVFIIAVPTPFGENHVPDISHVESAVQAMAPHLEPGNLVILESTSPVGMTEKIAEWLQELRPDLVIPYGDEIENTAIDYKRRVFLAHCPERVLPGQILRELIDNDRIVGGIDKSSAAKARAFYEIFVKGEIIQTSARTAELCKLAENAFRDVNIAFANEISLICDRVDVNVWELVELTNRHPRVNILQPGPGVGGHCIAVDPWFIAHAAPEESKLIRTARSVNDSKPHQVVAKIEQAATKFKRPVIACFGLAFKADIDDLRESPAVEIARLLAKKQVGKIVAVEPNIDKLPSSLTKLGIELADLQSSLREADILVLLVNHKQFNHVDREMLKRKVIIDTRGAWRS